MRVEQVVTSLAVASAVWGGGKGGKGSICGSRAGMVGEQSSAVDERREADDGVAIKAEIEGSDSGVKSDPTTTFPCRSRSIPIASATGRSGNVASKALASDHTLSISPTFSDPGPIKAPIMSPNPVTETILPGGGAGKLSARM